MSHIFTRTGDTTLLFDVELIVKQEWAIPENIHTPPMDDTELVPPKFQDSKKDSSSLCGIPNPADSES